MRRKRWVLISVLAALLALAVAGGTALAHGWWRGGDPSSNQDLMARIATTLGLEQQAVEDAFRQAYNDTRRLAEEEALKARLDRLVEAGRITQEQADQYMEWFRSRPDVATTVVRPFFGHPAKVGLTPSITDQLLTRVAEILGQDAARVKDAYNQAVRGLQEDALQARLDALVEEGRITQEQADQYMEWFRSRPDVSLTMPFHGPARFWGFPYGPGHGMGFWGAPHMRMYKAPEATPGASASGTVN